MSERGHREDEPADDAELVARGLQALVESRRRMLRLHNAVREIDDVGPAAVEGSDLADGGHQVREDFAASQKTLADVLHDVVSWEPLLGDDALVPNPEDLVWHTPAQIVYGPDVDDSGNARKFYRYTYTSDGASFFNDHSADHRTGRYSAVARTFGGAKGSLAAVGLRIYPALDDSTVRVRPLVRWSGGDVMRHDRADPQITTPVQMSAAGHLGIFVHSSTQDGKKPFRDVDHDVLMWHRTETNPSSGRGYGGTASVSDGLEAVFRARSDRRYWAYVYCWVEVWGVPAFGVDVAGTVSLLCEMPYVVVDERDV